MNVTKPTKDGVSRPIQTYPSLRVPTCDRCLAVKVLLIGSYPPPLGGVSVFLKRYKLKLESEGHAVDVVDPTRLTNLRLLFELVRARRYDLISLHYPSIPVLQVLQRLGLSGKTEVWDHNWRLLETWSAQQLKSYNSFVGVCRQLVLVTPNLLAYYETHGINLPGETRIQNAFLPPPQNEKDEILASYPEEVRHFLDQRRPLIVANAFKVVLEKGIDLYGLDLCVDLMADLKRDWPAAGFLFALAEIGDTDYFAEVQSRIAASQLLTSFRFLTGQREFWPLLKKADLMVRPTFTDGYAVSVAEALYCKCPVIASDVVARPEGTILFKNRDREDFVARCREVLAYQINL